MSNNMIRGIFAALLGIVTAGSLAGAGSRVASRSGTNGATIDAAADPWTASQTVQPAEFAKELQSSSAANRPTIACVGFRPLYQGAHIPGSSFHGAASTEQGITDLKDWAKDIPRSSNVVLYCGCCPLARCPNLRPAFTALREMGFTKLRVLILPTDFNTDWIEKGFPVEKGK